VTVRERERIQYDIESLDKAIRNEKHFRNWATDRAKVLSSIAAIEMLDADIRVLRRRLICRTRIRQRKSF